MEIFIKLESVRNKESKSYEDFLLEAKVPFLDKVLSRLFKVS